MFLLAHTFRKRSIKRDPGRHTVSNQIPVICYTSVFCIFIWAILQLQITRWRTHCSFFHPRRRHSRWPGYTRLSWVHSSHPCTMIPLIRMWHLGERISISKSNRRQIQVRFKTILSGGGLNKLHVLADKKKSLCYKHWHSAITPWVRCKSKWPIICEMCILVCY